MAKRTIKQTEATAGAKKVAPVRKATTQDVKVPRARTARAAATQEFVPPTAEEIAVRAYFRAKERGFAPGNAMEDWLAAEAELIAWRKGAAPNGKPAKKAPIRKKVERATGIEPV